MGSQFDEGSIQKALSPRLGPEIAGLTELTAPLAQVLRRYAPEREPLALLAQRLESCLFDSLYEVLGDDMALSDGHGNWTRLRMEELPDLADAVMSVFFATLEPSGDTCAQVMEYALRTGSVSAMAALCQRFDAFLPSAERTLIDRVLRDRCTPQMYAALHAAAPDDPAGTKERNPVP